MMNSVYSSVRVCHPLKACLQKKKLKTKNEKHKRKMNVIKNVSDYVETATDVGSKNAFEPTSLYQVLFSSHQNVYKIIFDGFYYKDDSCL